MPPVAPPSECRSVELFAGAGGLALGLARAGFRHEAVVERDAHAYATLLRNCALESSELVDWPVHRADVREFDYAHIRPGIDLLAAGVPCQPFSIGGKHLGPADPRNMFPELVRAILALRPKAILLENVRGLARPSFARYFSYIQMIVCYPEIARRAREGWRDHLSRLERHHTAGRHGGLFYRMVFRVLNAADYGVPQRRERLIMVAIRGDLGVEWSFPRATHSEGALLHEQFVTGEYWDRHRVPRRQRPAAGAYRLNIASGTGDLFGGKAEPWRTVRDAISDLPKPEKGRSPAGLGQSHFQVPGARPYVGHTGSDLDRPAKTLKAGDHGVPGGENTLSLGSGAVRYFTVRESARLQTFPDWFQFPGSWTESMRQIGNAVPVRLAEVLASGVLAAVGGVRRV